MVHKPSILEPETFSEKNRLYFYSVRFLLERVSWLCREKRNANDGDGTAEIVFSNRSGMSYENLRSYMQLLKDQNHQAGDWSVIQCDQILAYSAGKRMGLQIADAVASGFFKAVERSPYGHCEDRYARMLRPVVYKSRGKYQGYGIKIWPREANDLIRNDPRFAWFRQDYLRQNT